MQTLEFRRHHKKRIKAKAKRIVGDVTPKELGVRCNHGMTICSCHLCGNPRKHFNAKTIQELKQDEYCLVEDSYSGIESLAD